MVSQFIAQCSKSREKKRQIQHFERLLLRTVERLLDDQLADRAIALAPMNDGVTQDLLKRMAVPPAVEARVAQKVGGVLDHAVKTVIGSQQREELSELRREREEAQKKLEKWEISTPATDGTTASPNDLASAASASAATSGAEDSEAPEITRVRGEIRDDRDALEPPQLELSQLVKTEQLQRAQITGLEKARDNCYGSAAFISSAEVLTVYAAVNLHRPLGLAPEMNAVYTLMAGALAIGSVGGIAIGLHQAHQATGKRVVRISCGAAAVAVAFVIAGLRIATLHTVDSSDVGLFFVSSVALLSISYGAMLLVEQAQWKQKTLDKKAKELAQILQGQVGPRASVEALQERIAEGERSVAEHDSGVVAHQTFEAQQRSQLIAAKRDEVQQAKAEWQHEGALRVQSLAMAEAKFTARKASIRKHATSRAMRRDLRKDAAEIVKLLESAEAPLADAAHLGSTFEVPSAERAKAPNPDNLFTAYPNPSPPMPRAHRPRRLSPDVPRLRRYRVPSNESSIDFGRNGRDQGEGQRGYRDQNVGPGE